MLKGKQRVPEYSMNAFGKAGQDLPFERRLVPGHCREVLPDPWIEHISN